MSASISLAWRYIPTTVTFRLWRRSSSMMIFAVDTCRIGTPRCQNVLLRRHPNVISSPYTPVMRYRCIVSYRTSRSKIDSTWRTTIQADDFLAVTTKIVSQLERRHRRKVTVVGLYLQVEELKAT